MTSTRAMVCRAVAAPLATSAQRRAAWRAPALTLIAVIGLAAGASPRAQAQTFKVLYSFAGYPTDGAAPIGGLLRDATGNLYGTTEYGGNNDSCPYGLPGCGTVFKLDTNGVETVLHNFTGPDGAEPIATLAMDAMGDLYGTTFAGGLLQDCADIGPGCGVVFKLSGKKETVLHRFSGRRDGALPYGGVVVDASGALYGTANAAGEFGDGVAFRLVGKKETVLHAFTGGKDGGYITAGLIMDAKGNLYGTAVYGGDLNCDYPDGCGVVFKLTGKQDTVLYNFGGSPDGAGPAAALFMDRNGNFYSTTAQGGLGDNLGTVFELSRHDKERVLYIFQYGHDGVRPTSGVVRDAQGNLYGTTAEGMGKAFPGIVYQITKDGKEKILHYFCTTDCSDGANPYGDLIMDANGNLYGTASNGGAYNNGTVFMITP